MSLETAAYDHGLVPEMHTNSSALQLISCLLNYAVGAGQIAALPWHCYLLGMCCLKAAPQLFQKGKINAKWFQTNLLICIFFTHSLCTMLSAIFQSFENLIDNKCSFKYRGTKSNLKGSKRFSIHRLSGFTMPACWQSKYRFNDIQVRIE